MPKKNRGNFKRLLGNFDSSLSVGKRFIFFQSLSETASKEGSALFGNIYKQVYNLGLNYVNQAMSKLTGIQNGTINNTLSSSILKYIEEIGKAANNELSVQTDFINKIYKNLGKDHPLKQLIQQHEYLLNPDPKNKRFNYTQFMNILNQGALQYLKAQEERTQTILHNSRLIESNLLAQEEQIQAQIKEAFLTKDYRQYQTKLRDYDILKKIDDNNIFEKSYTDIITKKANEMMQYFMKHLDSKILQPIIQNSITSDLSIDEQQINIKLFAYIIEYLTTADYSSIISNTAGQLREDFEDFLKTAKTITQQRYKDIKNSVTNTTVKSIEQTSIIFGQGVAQIFISLKESAREEIMNRYHIKNEIQEILKEIQNLSKISAAQKGKITKILNKAIADQYNLDLKALRDPKMKTADRRAIVKKIEELQKQGLAKAFSPVELQNSLKNSLRIKITTGNFAELITKIAIERMLSTIGSGKVSLLGNALKVKADVGFSISFSSFKNLNGLSNVSEEIKEQLKDSMLNLQDNFLSDLKSELSKNNNATNVAAAVTTHFNTYKNLMTKINNLVESKKISQNDKQKILDQFKELITSQISIKEYAKSGPFGFQGGSLGAGDRAGPVLENIGKMYETGGITPIDYETLYFAAINCGGDALGAGLKQPLQQYLLGGAALMMFDDGFTATENYLKTMENELGFSKGTLHLYSVQGKLVPASYVLSSIYQNLLTAYQTIISQSDTLPEVIAASSENAVTINNGISSANIPNWRDMPAPQNRWNKVAADASANITIKFTFLGGMLDMFEAIPNAFNI